VQVIRLSCSPWRLLGTAATPAPHTPSKASAAVLVLIILCVWLIWLACISVHEMHAWGLRRPEASVGFPRTRVTDDCMTVNSQC
jgi:threonine/homoserine/homoserine lactone efflux protein